MALDWNLNMIKKGKGFRVKFFERDASPPLDVSIMARTGGHCDPPCASSSGGTH